jgi:formylmethanofuran dehydrogenase subunit E
LPKTIDEVTDDILDKVILCEDTGRPFRIITQELEFYRKHHLPLPTKHQDTRFIELRQKRMPKEFHIANCEKCKQEMLSVYNPESGFKVYCETCYNKEIY